MKDLEFHIDIHGSTTILDDFPRAIELAAILSIGSGEPVNVDVVCWSEKAAHHFGGESGVEDYLEDPDASVHKRISVKAEDLGRVP